MLRSLLAGSTALAVLGLLCAPAFAQSAAPGAILELDPILVDGQRGSGTAATLRAQLHAVPVAADVVAPAETAAQAAPTLAAALSFSPGVVVQQFMGGNDQPRIQIRGSGLQQNPTERGLLILQDGMPVNRADGTFIVGLAAAGQAEAIEVFRGAAANRLGAAYLGGALNFISPTAETAPGTQLDFGLGSFGRRSVSGSHAIAGEKASALLRFELSGSEGERQFNHGQHRAVLGGNFGYDWGDGLRTQLFFNHADLQFDVAGPLSWSDLQSDPTRINENPMTGPANGNGSGIGPNAARDLPQRDTTQTLIGTRTTLERGAHRFDAGFSYSRTEDEFIFPIAHGVRVTEGWDANLMARYAYLPDGADLPLFEATLNHGFGQADRSYFYNAGGARGAQFGANEFKARTTTAYLGANLPLGGEFLVAPSLSYTRATRDNAEAWAARAGTGADTSFAQTYDGWSPALALRWTPSDTQTAWISLSKSFDAPTSDDLISPAGGTVNSNPATVLAADLQAQRAKTLEIGWRGQGAVLGWDVVAYHAQIDNELLQLNTSSGVPYITNADKTVHNGLELGLNAAFSPVLQGRLAYSWQDFRFDDDATRGNNTLAGAPRNLLRARLDWQASDRLTLSGTLSWRDEIWVDNANTTRAKAATLLDLGARYALNDRTELVAELSNVTDERYATAIVAMDNATAMAGNGAVYLPGAGRAAYLGLKMRF